MQKKRTDQRRERCGKKKTKNRLGSPKWIKYETYFSPEHDDTRQGLWTQLMSLHKIELSCLQLNSGVAGNVHAYSKRKVIFIKSNGNLQPYCFFGFFWPMTPWGLSWLLACLRSDLLLRVCCLQQGPAHPFPELTLSGSLFMWSQSLPSVTSHQLDQ